MFVHATRETLHAILPGDANGNARWLYGQIVEWCQQSRDGVYSVEIAQLIRVSHLSVNQDEIRGLLRLLRDADLIEAKREKVGVVVDKDKTKCEIWHITLISQEQRQEHSA